MSKPTIDALVNAVAWWKIQRAPEEVEQRTASTNPTGLYVVRQSVADGKPANLGDFVRTLDRIDYDEGKVYFSTADGEQFEEELNRLFFDRFYVFNLRAEEIPKGARKLSDVKVNSKGIAGRHNRLWRLAFNRILQNHDAGPSSGIQTYIRPITSAILATALIATIGISATALYRMETNPVQHEQEELDPITHDAYRDIIEHEKEKLTGKIKKLYKEANTAKRKQAHAQKKFATSRHAVLVEDPFTASYNRRHVYSQAPATRLSPSGGRGYNGKSEYEFIHDLLHYIKQHKVPLTPEKGADGHDGFSFELDENIIKGTSYPRPRMYDFWVCTDLVKLHNASHAALKASSTYDAQRKKLQERVGTINRFALDFGVEPLRLQKKK